MLQLKKLKIMTIQTFKKGKKIICYITGNDKGYMVCTGKPSDTTCFSWFYDNLTDAQFTANEYFNNRTQKI